MPINDGRFRYVEILSVFLTLGHCKSSAALADVWVGTPGLVIMKVGILVFAINTVYYRQRSQLAKKKQF